MKQLVSGIGQIEDVNMTNEYAKVLVDEMIKKRNKRIELANTLAISFVQGAGIFFLGSILIKMFIG